MKCNVTLDNGEVGVFTATGELNYDGKGFTLTYELDGDECTLVFANGALTQIRRGALNVKMTFAEGEETQCEISDGELTGSFALFTEKLDVTFDKSGTEIFIRYDCSGEKTGLSIKAKI